MAGTESNADDETVAVDAPRSPSTRRAEDSPMWSTAGDDPLIVGDELQ